MSGCIHCSEPYEGNEIGKSSCCWARAMEIKKFKNLVFHKYITEVIFDLIVSVASVITDIISLILYIKKGHYELAIITAIPVLLPTLVFTNIYMADETQGYCKLPAKRPPSRNSDTKGSKFSSTSDLGEGGGTMEPNTRLGKLHSKIDFHWPTLHFFCSSCQSCWGGIFHTVFTNDQDIRVRGMHMARKSIKRLSKYFFGTFVLRFIALAWYFKALNFGIKAFKEPKKYMKIERPNAHWSYDLLVRLDFLQAALENAPQCIVQLYVLLTYADENTTLGIMTLLFSFMDFIRVSVSVQWDLRRGPVIAPSGCYSTISWKLLNVCSWIFLYIGRSAALALVIATASGWSISIPVILLVTHLLLFGKLFSQRKYGVAAQKVFVSVFISIFFLPEFESTEPLRLIQFYYAVVHVQNVLFIIPWMGVEYKYCTATSGSIFGPEPTVGTPKLNQTLMNPSEETEDFLNGTFRSITDWLSKNTSSYTGPKECLIDPHYIIMAVPALTVIGIVMRLAASKRMAEFKENIPKREETMIMEERVAKIYRKKWTQMSIKHMTAAFIKMLRKEVIASDEIDKNEKDDQSVYFISKTLDREFRASQQFIRQAFSFVLPQENLGKTQRSMSVDANAGSNFIRRRKVGLEGNSGFIEGIDEIGKVQRSKSHDNVTIVGLYDTGGTQKAKDEKTTENVPSCNGTNTNDEFQLVRVTSLDGPPYYLEMAWI